MMEPFLVSNYLHSNLLIGFVIIAFESLTKASLAKVVKYFISVGNMILQYNIVIPSLIIIPIVVFILWGPLDLLGLETKIVDFRIV